MHPDQMAEELRDPSKIDSGSTGNEIFKLYKITKSECEVRIRVSACKPIGLSVDMSIHRYI